MKVSRLARKGVPVVEGHGRSNEEGLVPIFQDMSVSEFVSRNQEVAERHTSGKIYDPSRHRVLDTTCTTPVSISIS